jgi:dihydrofolate synthase / folylpolyglutamate synthase
MLFVTRNLARVDNDRVLKALEGRFPTRMVPDLDRIRDLLDLLGEPQRSFPSIHSCASSASAPAATRAPTCRA